MKQRTYQFNLIEIVLAVAIVGFGVVVILGMLPKGMRATQNAGIEAYSSEVIDQLGSYLQSCGISSVTASAATEQDEKTLVSNFSGKGEIIDQYVMRYYNTLVLQTNAWESFENGGHLKYFQRTNMPGVFKIRQDNDLETEFGEVKKSDLPKVGDLYVIVMGNALKDEDDEVETKVDFSGLLRVWKRPLVYQCVVRTQIDNPEEYSVKIDESVNFSKNATVCMELSYPLSVPYAERTKRYYSFDVEKTE